MRTSLEIVAELTIEFSRAESACKAFEHQDGGLPIPVVNELRYAGAHAIKALKRGIDDSEECREELDKALRHCKRARYDALEFNVVLATERLDKCIDMYRGYEWLAAPLIPRYYEHSRLIREAGHKLESTSGIDKESELYIGNCMEHIRTIEAFIQDFETAMPVIFSAIRHEKEKDARVERLEDKQAKRSWWQTLVTVLLSGAIGALIAWLIS